MNQINIFILYCFILIGCGVKNSTSQNDISQHDESFTINFPDNVTSLNPYEAKSSSERFIRSLVFEQLFVVGKNGKYSSRIVNQYTNDSLLNIHSFQLFDNVWFHNGKKLNITQIKSSFTSILKNIASDTSVFSFFTSIKGYGVSNNYDNDPLPSGIQFYDNNRFTINSTLSVKEMMVFLCGRHFYITDDGIGTGSFQITERDDDISYILERTDREANSVGNLFMIKMRFIKNQNEVISEFFNKSLNIIKFNPKICASKKYCNNLYDQTQKKYPDYQITKSENAIVEYATIYNVSNSRYKEEILKSINSYFNLDFNVPVSNDTAMYIHSLANIQLQVVDERATKTSLLADSLNFTYVHKDSLNPIQPYIILKEKNMLQYQIDSALIYNIKNIYESEPNPPQTLTIALIAKNPYYYFTTFDIAGIKEYQSLTEIVNNATIKNMKEY